MLMGGGRLTTVFIGIHVDQYAFYSNSGFQVFTLQTSGLDHLIGWWVAVGQFFLGSDVDPVRSVGAGAELHVTMEFS